MTSTESNLETEHDHPIPPGPHEHDHPKDSLYIVVALILAVLTALEVMTYYVDFGPLFLPTLLTLMAVKFLLVVLFFMHLKFDAPIFGRFFWGGLGLAVVVYVATLATFQVFSG
jgi:cytochrome c oxidase subunit 4